MKKKNTLVKFGVVAAMVGLFSPSVSIQTAIPSGDSYRTAPAVLSVSLFNTAEARRDGNRNRSGNRNKNTNRNKNVNKNKNVNRNKNVNKNKNVNRNVNKNVNVNVNHRNNRHYGSYRGRSIVGFTAGLAVGSVIAASTMPTTCTTVITNGISYRRCGSSYYQPFYQGDTVVYQVVNSPY